MSNENIAAVRRLTQEGFVGGKVDVVDDVVADSCVDHDPLPGQSQGAAGQKQTCQMVVAGLSDRRTLQDDLLAIDDVVVENWLFEGTHTGDFMGVPATNKDVTMEGIANHRIVDGRIVEHWSQIDGIGMLAQMGVLPPIGG